MIAQTLQIGHLHPLVVHLPIGILIVGFLLEITYRKKSTTTTDELIQKVLLFGALSAMISLGTGWLLGEDGGYDESLLFLHRWLAVAFTVLSVGLYYLKKSPQTWCKQAYLPAYLLVLILIGITGHYGGSMTHGEDYLFIDNTKKEKIIEDVNKALVYADIIQPIFEAKCVSCHNTSKVKGGLLMDTQQNLLAGGDSGSIFDSISEQEPSRILKFLHLPLENEDHMPPKGKVQLTAEELALINWWMQQNHCFDCTAGTLNKSEKIAQILKSLEQDTSPRALLAKEVKPVPQEWLAEVNSKGVAASTLATGSPLLLVNLYGKKNITKEGLKSLKKYAENVVELNLGNSNFNDTLSKTLASFKNVTKLQLQNTVITNKTLEQLKSFTHLESLNIYGDSITDDGLKHLKQLPNLKQLYTWQTKISDASLASFKAAYPKVQVQGKINEELFRAVKLDPPTILAQQDFFKDSLAIQLDYPFDDVGIYYTLDGSEPDSTSTKYSKPVVIKQSTELKACTYASGYKLSKVNSSSFKKFKYEYASIQLNKKPSERYKGQGATTLSDLKRGSTNFVDGHWLGYDGTHFTATLELKNKETISTVSVGALSSPDQWIFYPTGFRVWVSTNGTDYTLAKTQNVPKEKINTLSRFRFFDVHLPPTQAKYVRVQVKSQLKNPSWHPNPGGNSWLFVDEIILN